MHASLKEYNCFINRGKGISQTKSVDAVLQTPVTHSFIFGLDKRL